MINLDIGEVDQEIDHLESVNEVVLERNSLAIFYFIFIILLFIFWCKF